jgi:chromosomal replication initiator protein
MDKLKELWDEILLSYKNEYGITDIAYNTFLKPLRIFSLNNNRLTLVFQPESGAADQLTLDIVSRKYQAELRVKIAEFTGTLYDIDFILPKDIPMDAASENEPALPINNNQNYRKSNLNARYTFDTFVVGNNSRFAHTAALAVAESPGEAYNPLYIYGGPGLGKTHLMHSIGNYVLSQHPEMEVLYVTSEEFLNEVIESIRSSNNATSMSKFRDKYRSVDVLMIDDIQFIIGKESTQEEFFNTFNVLYSKGKQIVLTSDRPPKELETLEERLRQRFEMGLMADIGNPDYETRMAILRKKVESKHINFDDNILDYIATNIKSNIREIEGALNKLVAYSNLEKKEITMEIAERELQNIISPDKPRAITPQFIIEVVASYCTVNCLIMEINRDVFDSSDNDPLCCPLSYSEAKLFTDVIRLQHGFNTCVFHKEHTEIKSA